MRSAVQQRVVIDVHEVGAVARRLDTHRDRLTAFADEIARRSHLIGGSAASARLRAAAATCDRSARQLRAITQAAATADALTVRDPLASFAGGAWDALTGTARLLADLNPARRLEDPDGHTAATRELWDGLRGSAQLLWRDPVGFAAAMVDIDTLRSDPARWLGALAPDLLLGGAVRGVRRGADAVEHLVEVRRVVGGAVTEADLGRFRQLYELEPSLTRQYLRWREDAGAIDFHGVLPFPGGGLLQHEGRGLRSRGHTILEHVGTSLWARRNATGAGQTLSSFADLASAERFIGEALRREAPARWDWLRADRDGHLTIDVWFDEVTGSSLLPDGTVQPATGVRIILRRDDPVPSLDYRIHTAYPTTWKDASPWT